MKQLYVYSCFCFFLLVSFIAYNYLYASSFPASRGSISFKRLRETLEERQDVKEGGNCSGFTSMTSQTSLIECIKYLQKNWIQNSQKAKELRFSMRHLHTAETFATIFKEVSTSDLSKKSPFKENAYNVCSLVGSSGVLSGSNCHREIDSADFIFRFNVPKVVSYATDVGWKSNFTSLNPISVIERRYSGLKKEKDKKHFLLDMNHYNFVWVPGVFQKSKDEKRFRAIILNLATRALETLNQSNIEVPALLFGNESHYKETQKYWASAGINPEISHFTAGFYITSVALSLCNEVRLYGFWPFPVDLNQQVIPYHYYDRAKVSYRMSGHDYKSEFFTLLRLHTEGILKLHVGNCQT